MARRRRRTTAGSSTTVVSRRELVRDLHRAGLVDRYVLLIHPIVLGSGTKLFADGDRSDLRVRRSVISPTGVVAVEYEGVRP